MSATPTRVAAWLRTTAPIPTPRAPNSAATVMFRHSTSATSAAPSVGAPREDRISMPTTMISSDNASVRTRPANAWASVLAASKRTRSGAASTELVIVR